MQNHLKKRAKTFQGSVTLGVTLQERNDRTATVRFQVRDTGINMSPSAGRNF